MPTTQNTGDNSTTADDSVVTLTGSGLVFDNTFGSNVNAAFKADVVIAENALQADCTNDCTVDLNFGIAPLSNPNFNAENSYADSTTQVSFDDYLAALQANSSSAIGQAAANAIAGMVKTHQNGPPTNPTGGDPIVVPTGLAQILGLATSTTAFDDNITLAPTYKDAGVSYAWSASSGVTGGFDVISILEHEITEGALGRISYLGYYGTGPKSTPAWAPMDFFRYDANGAFDPKYGTTTPIYFSYNGSGINSTTSFQYNNSTTGGDFADWIQKGPDANASDPFGPGPDSASAGLSSVDQQVLETLGYTPASELAAGSGVSVSSPTAVAGGSDQISFSVTNNGLGDSRSFNVGIYLSTDATITTSDTLVGYVNIDSVGYGQTVNETADFSLPVNYGLGAYHVGVIVDYDNELIEFEPRQQHFRHGEHHHHQADLCLAGRYERRLVGNRLGHRWQPRHSRQGRRCRHVARWFALHGSGRQLHIQCHQQQHRNRNRFRGRRRRAWRIDDARDRAGLLRA